MSSTHFSSTLKNSKILSTLAKSRNQNHHHHLTIIKNMEISSVSLSSSFPKPSLSSNFPSSTSFFFNPNSSSFLAPSKSRTISFSKTRTEGAKRGLSCTCLFGLGVPELVIIGGVAALLFGPKNLPGVGKSIGKTVKSFQQAAKEFESELKKEPDTLTDSPEEQQTTTISEDKKQEMKDSSPKDSL